MDKYAAIWFSQDEVALVKLKGFTWVGKATKSSVNIFTTWEREDQEGRRWRFKRVYGRCPRY